MTQFEHLQAHIRMEWPDARLYRCQRETLEALTCTPEVGVTAGNQLGKDWLAGLVATCFFRWPWLFFPVEHFQRVEARRKEGQPSWQVHTRRIVTTSVNERHLKVLWGEIGRFVSTCRTPLHMNKGGPLAVNFQEIRLAEEWADKNPLNYLMGCVSEKGEGLAGHHAEYTMCIIDEASGADDQVYTFIQGWCKRLFAFGNPHPTNNFWRRMIDGGDLVATS